MITTHHRLAMLPIYVLFADLIFGVIQNIKDALIPTAQAIPQDGLPISPKFVFGWIQVVANGGMALLLIWAVWSLIRLLHHYQQGRTIPFSGSHLIALLLVLAFTLPAIWQWFWAIFALFQGHWLIEWRNIRYLLAAWCQLYLLTLPIALYRAYQANHTTHQPPKVPQPHTSYEFTNTTLPPANNHSSNTS